MKIIPVILLLILSINIAQAEEGIAPKLIEYDVEVIILEDAHARYINSEYWHENPDLDIPVTETDAGTEISEKNNNEKMKKGNFRTIKPVILGQEYKRINNSSEYNVLFYGAWRQAGLDENNAFEIKIEDLDNTHKTKSENSITGQLKLVLSRYLHIYADLEYQRNQKKAITEKPAADTLPVDSSESEETPYTINIHRRMRSKELHYIDHPLIGMLIQINPVKPPVENTDKTKEQ
jgi:hypothetical protein